MTLSEFKAWFEGFTEGMDAAPDEKQWDRIKARVKEIDGVHVTRTVYLDHYVPPYRPYWTTLSCRGVGASDGIGNIAFNGTGGLEGDGGIEFNSHSAMLSLGKAEYASSSPRSTS